MAKIIKKINERIDNLTMGFKNEFDDFKNELQNLKQSADSNAGNVDATKNVRNLLKRFNDFEANVNKSLEQLNVGAVKAEELSKNIFSNVARRRINSLSEKERTIEELINALNKISNIQKSDICCFYRIGIISEARNRPVVAKFVHHWKRNYNFYQKKKLKGTKIAISEYLSAETLSLYKEARKTFPDKCQTQDGRIYINHNRETFPRRSQNDLYSINQSSLMLLYLFIYFIYIYSY